MSTLVRAWLAGVALAAAPALVCAQADLRPVGSVTGIIVTQTRIQSLSFVATNLGPAVATNVVASSAPFTISQSNLALTATCAITFAGPSTAQVVTWPIGTMGVGEQRTCAITLRAVASATSSSTTFGLRLTGDQPDPGTLNNSFGTVFVVSSFDAISDLAIAVTKAPAAGLLPTDGTGRLCITLTNRGPQAALTAQAISDYYDSPFQNTHQFLIFGVPEDPCDSQINVELSATRVITGPRAGLPAGASITCVLGIERRVGAAGGDYALGWTTFLAGFGSDDPDATNNQATVILGISVPPIAVATWSYPAACLLVLLLLMTTARAARTRE